MCSARSGPECQAWTAASFDVPRPGWDFFGEFGVLIGSGSGSVFSVDRRDCSLRLSAPSPNRRATSKQVLLDARRHCSPCSECVRGAVSGQNGAECDAVSNIVPVGACVHVSLRSEEASASPCDFFFEFLFARCRHAAPDGSV
eukprot:scaffold8628_cov111-Isochrysis_galbana.AAC.6